MTGRYLEESLTYSNRPELSRRHTRGYREAGITDFFFSFFPSLLESERRGRRLLFIEDLGIRYVAESLSASLLRSRETRQTRYIFLRVLVFLSF